jgi:hypothetical protein
MILVEKFGRSENRSTKNQGFGAIEVQQFVRPHAIPEKKQIHNSASEVAPETGIVATCIEDVAIRQQSRTIVNRAFFTRLIIV